MFVPMRLFTVDVLKSHSVASNQHCIAIDVAALTLATIMRSEDKTFRCDAKRFHRFLLKIRKVLEKIGNAINHLHQGKDDIFNIHR